MVFREVIDNVQTFLDLKENNPDAYAKIFQKNQNIQAAEVVQSENTPFSAGNSGVDPKIGLLSDLSSESEKALLMAPPNSIVGVVVTPGFEYDSTPKIFYPMFPPHLSFPVKPGETVWVVNPGRKDEFSTPFGSKKTAQESAVSGELTNAGFWICRIPSPAYVDDLNFTHDDRSRSYYYRDSQEPNVNLSDFPPDFSNGPYSDGRSPTLYDSSYDFSNIRAKSLSNNLTSRESVPRFTKRPGDLVIQGSNNTVTSNININGTTLAETSDTDLLTLASGVLTVAGEVSMTTLDIGGTNVTSTAAELNILDGVTATAAEINALDGITSTVSELNILDGDTSASSVTIADADQIILNDNGTMKQVAVSALNTYTSSSIAADDISTGDAAVSIATSAGNITIDAQASDADIIFKGTDGGVDITALTLDMSAAGAATFNNKIIATELDISGDVDIDGTLETDALTINGTTLAETISDTVGAMVGSNTETGIAVTYEDSDNTLDFVLGSSQTTISSLTNASLVIGRDADNDIDFATDNTILFRTDGADQIKLINGALVPVTDNDIDLGTSSLEFKDAYFDGTVTADAFAGPLTGDVTGNVSGTAATVTTAAQSNITSLGTLTTLTVDNVIVNGTTIGHTDDTDLITLADGIATVAGEISVTTLDIGGTNLAETAAELNIMDGNTSATSTTLADADRLVTNDNGTMVQVALSDVKTYLTSAGFSSEDPTALAIALG